MSIGKLLKIQLWGIRVKRPTHRCPNSKSHVFSTVRNDMESLKAEVCLPFVGLSLFKCRILFFRQITSVSQIMYNFILLPQKTTSLWLLKRIMSTWYRYFHIAGWASCLFLVPLKKISFLSPIFILLLFLCGCFACMCVCALCEYNALRG